MSTCANQCFCVPDKLLIAEHQFYGINFRDWACLSGDESEYETEDEDEDELQTLSEAVAKYPDRAVLALFNQLGLVYSNFREQFDRQKTLETAEPEKRALDANSATGFSSLKRLATKKARNPSSGSTTEVIS